MQNFLTEFNNENARENAFVTCPIGVLFLLSMLFGSGGPRGRTGSQIAKTLQLRSPHTDSNLTTAMSEAKFIYRDIYDDLTSEQTFINNRRVNVITATNGVFTRRDYKISPHFDWSVKNEFHSATQQLDFVNQSESARYINNWVNTETRGLIQRIFNTPDELPADTVVAMFNVFTFKDTWQRPFFATQTTPEEFRVTQSKTIRVATMNSIEDLLYASISDKGIAVIKKPFENYRFSFVVILPTTKWNLDALTPVINGQYPVKQILQEMEHRVVSLKLPKFQLTRTAHLIGTLRRMGITELFHRTAADLSGITSTERLYVSTLKQSVALKVDEVGVEAAAVTGAIAVPMSLMQPTAEFHVNHPFLCMIYDETLNIPLVMARVTEPGN